MSCVGTNHIKDEPEWEDYCISEAQARAATRAGRGGELESGPEPPDTNGKTDESIHSQLNSIKGRDTEQNNNESATVKEEREAKSWLQELTGLYEDTDNTDKLKIPLDLYSGTSDDLETDANQEPNAAPPVFQKPKVVNSRQDLMVINNIAQEVNRKRALQPVLDKEKISRPVIITKYVYTPMQQPVVSAKTNSLFKKPDGCNKVTKNPEIGLLPQPLKVANVLLKNNLVSVSDFVKKQSSTFASQVCNQTIPLSNSVAYNNPCSPPQTTETLKQPLPTGIFQPIRAPGVPRPLPKGVFRPVTVPIAQLNGKVCLKPLKNPPSKATNGIPKLRRVTISKLQPGSVSKLQPGTISKLHPVTISKLQPGTIFKLHPDTISKLKPETKPELQSGSISKLQPETIPKLQSGSISKLQPWTISKLHPVTISKLQRDGISKLQPGSFYKLQSDTISKLQIGNISKLQPGTITKLHPGTISKFQPSPIFILQPDTISKLQLDSNSDLQPGTKPKLQTGSISNLQPGTISQFQPETIPKLRSGSISKLQPGTIPKLQTNTVLTLKTNVLNLQSGPHNLGSATTPTSQPSRVPSSLLESVPKYTKVSAQIINKTISSNRYDSVKLIYQKTSTPGTLKSNITATPTSKPTPMVSTSFQRIAPKPILKLINSQIPKTVESIQISKNINSGQANLTLNNSNIQRIATIAPRTFPKPVNSQIGKPNHNHIPQNENGYGKAEITQNCNIQREAPKTVPNVSGPVNSLISESIANDIIPGSINDDRQVVTQNLPPNSNTASEASDKVVNLEDFLKPSYVVLERMQKRTCEDCEKTFYEHKAFIDHIKTSQKWKKPVSSLGNDGGTRKGTTKIDSSLPSLTCQYCQKLFSKNFLLSQHVRRNHLCRIRKFHCDYCGKKCLERRHLVDHIRTHTGEKPYKCLICKTRHRTASNLTSHNITRHRNRTKKHFCPICNRPFHMTYNLKKHIRMHSGERLHVCEICNKRFIEKYHLKSHLESHSGVRCYHCNTCKKQFTRKSHLVSHEKNIHKKRRSLKKSRQKV